MSPINEESAVDTAVKLWIALEHPKSALEGRSLSDRLTGIHYEFTLEEHTEYRERIWEIVQKRRKEQNIQLGM